jgi:hypothetical protein
MSEIREMPTLKSRRLDKKVEEEHVWCEICHAEYSNKKEEDAQGFRLVSKFEDSELVIYQP